MGKHCQRCNDPVSGAWVSDGGLVFCSAKCADAFKADGLLFSWPEAQPPNEHEALCEEALRDPVVAAAYWENKAKRLQRELDRRESAAPDAPPQYTENMHTAQSSRRAAVSLVEQDGKLLCVWNRRYQGWSLPGGMVEEGESIEDGQRRELAEEVGLETLECEQVFEGEHGIVDPTKARPGRASYVHVFRVKVAGRPQAVEEGCPIDWLTPEEFLARSPFRSFYEQVFAKLYPRTDGIASGRASHDERTCVNCGGVEALRRRERDVIDNAIVAHEPKDSPGERT